MDAREILGALLGKKSGSGSSAGSILRDLLGGGGRKQPPAAVPQRQAQPPRRHEDFQDMARDAYARFERRQGRSQQECRSELDNERAVVLVRAMVNAAKADGQLDKQEQDKILGQLGDVTQDEIQFLRKEFATPLDVREFAWSVPLGMEEQVYGFSVMAIGIDQHQEARYLEELAHGLRLPPEACNQIRGRFNQPATFG